MFTLPLEPVPCPRPRIALRGRFPCAYYPAVYTKWKKEAVEFLANSMPALGPFSGPLQLRAVFHVERPRTSKLDHPKPDIDNYLKSLMDAITEAGWWNDDSQIREVHAEKRWAEVTAEGCHPHIEFDITLL